MAAMLYLYVEDVDVLFTRALAAGAESVSSPADQNYGDRNAVAKDSFGNLWYMATHIRD